MKIALTFDHQTRTDALNASLARGLVKAEDADQWYGPTFENASGFSLTDYPGYVSVELVNGDLYLYPQWQIVRIKKFDNDPRTASVVPIK